METYEQRIISDSKFVTSNIFKLYDCNNEVMEIKEEIKEEGRQKPARKRDED